MRVPPPQSVEMYRALKSLGVPNMYQYALIGAIVLTAIILDVRFRQAAKGGLRRA